MPMVWAPGHEPQKAPKIGLLHALRRRLYPERFWQRYLRRLEEQQRKYDRWQATLPKGWTPHFEPCGCEDGLYYTDESNDAKLCPDCNGTGKVWLDVPPMPFRSRPDPGVRSQH